MIFPDTSDPLFVAICQAAVLPRSKLPSTMRLGSDDGEMVTVTGDADIVHCEVLAANTVVVKPGKVLVAKQLLDRYDREEV